MNAQRKPLELSETYLHYNNLIWQVPSWGIAIAASVAVAAAKIDDDNATWVIPLHWVRAIILLFGAFLLFALTVALYRYRAYQAASAPNPIPRPPFGEPPGAARYLQGALSLTAGGILGFGVAEGLSYRCILPVGMLFGIFCWILAECGHKRVVSKIEAANKSLQPTAAAPSS